MLRNYKKIATGTFSLNFSIRSSEQTKLVLIKKDSNTVLNYFKLKVGIKIPLNLQFNPSIFYITIPKISNEKNYTREVYVVLNNKAHYQSIIEGEHYAGLIHRSSEPVGYIESISKDEAVINLSIANGHMDDGAFKMVGECEWVAIE